MYMGQLRKTVIKAAEAFAEKIKKELESRTLRRFFERRLVQ